jgi:hypothetical protein
MSPIMRLMKVSHESSVSGYCFHISGMSPLLRIMSVLLVKKDLNPGTILDVLDVEDVEAINP